MPKTILKTRICPGCGKKETDISRNLTEMFCSRECWRKNFAGKYLRTGKDVDCLNCGKKFYLRGAYVGIRKFCSRSCNVSYKRPEDKKCVLCKKKFKTRHRKQRFCSYRCSKVGPLNPNWKPGTKRQRGGIKNLDWSRAVFVRDNFTCVVCGEKKKKLAAHHKDGYHWCKKRRFDVSNGVTLCRPCHTDFHNTFGRLNNTEKQWKKYLKMRISP